MSNSKKFFSVCLALVCALLIAQAVQAQDSPFTIDNVPNVVGVGVAMLPDYFGSNDYTMGAAPFFKFTYPKSEWYLMLRATQLSANIVNHPWLRLGPIVNYRFGRTDDVEDNEVKRMTEIDDTVEAGAFVGVEFITKDNPRQRFSANVEFLSDVANEYNGYLVSASARYWYPVHKAVDVTLGVSTTYADDNYMKTYFGVNEIDADRSGLPIFAAEGGMRDISVTPGVVVHLSMNWHVAAGLKYFYLMDDAKDSPIVDDEGDANQWIAGVGVAYSW
jgi:outer membrane protein